MAGAYNALATCEVAREVCDGVEFAGEKFERRLIKQQLPGQGVSANTTPLLPGAMPPSAVVPSRLPATSMITAPGRAPSVQFGNCEQKL